jgi:hypothetical protein
MDHCVNTGNFGNLAVGSYIESVDIMAGNDPKRTQYKKQTRGSILLILETIEL